MSDIARYCILFFLSSISTCIITFLLIRTFPTLGIVDIPDQRRLHKKTTPRGGGLAVVIVMIIGLTLYEYITTGIVTHSLKLLIPLFLIASISFFDDLFSVHIIIRFIIHILTAVIAISSFLSPALLFQQNLTEYFDFPLSVIILACFINLYNFLDGIDGITCSESIHLSTTILILCYLKSDLIINVHLIIITNIIILGSCLGFLVFNWHPAKIFLGDVGSISLGFLTGISLLLIAASSFNLFFAACIACLYYIVDGGGTLLLRIIRREKFWQPHLRHFFQQAIKNGQKQTEVVTKIIICNLALMLLSVLSLYLPFIAIISAIFIIIILLFNFTNATSKR